MTADNFIFPKPINHGDTVGICTPSSPAHCKFREKFDHAVSELQRVGFRVKLGELTAQMTDEGYRSGTPKARADEFMQLIADDEVDFLMATIGGNNSSSMIPYLDFDLIREKRKVFVGYSDVTSLHMAILTQSRLSTFYGVAVVPTFGEYPAVFPDSLASFLAMGAHDSETEYALPHFKQWSNHKRSWTTDDWKTLPREYSDNPAPTVLCAGCVEAPIVVANLNTLQSLAGTPYFPDVDGKVLLLEQMSVAFPNEERMWTSLKLMGVFDRIAGLIIGKPEMLDTAGAPFDYDMLVMECIGEIADKHGYPVISGFDCSHTHPMHTIPQMVKVRLDTTLNAAASDTSAGQSMLTILSRAVDSK